MGFLTQLLRPAALNLMDDRYWTPANMRLGGQAMSGVNVSAGTALMSSAVWGCTRLIAESLAMMPIHVYQRQADGGKKRAYGHPLYTVLHDDPNDLQTAFVWKRTMMVQALLYGGGYSRIVPGPRGAVDRLEPIHAEMIRAEMLPGGGRRWQVRGEDGLEHPVNDEDIFYIPGLSVDGTNGLGLVQYARESIGLALAAQAYTSTFYKHGAQPMGLIKMPGSPKNEPAYDKLREDWQSRQAGPENWHKTPILHGGMEWVQTGMNHSDADLVNQLYWSAEDVARFFNVPLHMIQLMTKSTSWGSGLEEMAVGFVTYTLMPWASNWEQMITKRLMVAPQTYFAEFLMDSLMRGKLLDRYQAYAAGRQWGWLSVNDVRRLENMNPVDDGDGYMQPLNMTEIGAPPAPAPAPPRNQTAGHYQVLLHEAAARVVRKEIAAMSKAAKRCGGDEDAWWSAIRDFYQDHTAFVQQTMCISHEAAACFVHEQQAALINDGPSCMTDWETRRVADLIALALGGEDAISE